MRTLAPSASSTRQQLRWLKGSPMSRATTSAACRYGRRRPRSHTRLPKRRGGLGLGEAEHLIQGVEAAPLLPHSVAGDPDPAEGGGHPPGFQALLRPLRSGGRPAVEDPESLAVELPGRPPSLRLDPVLQSDRIEVVLDRHL